MNTFRNHLLTGISLLFFCFQLNAQTLVAKRQAVIKSARQYKGIAIESILPTDDRKGVLLKTADGKNFFLNREETRQELGITITDNDFILPKDASLTYYDQNGVPNDNYNNYSYVNTKQGFPSLIKTGRINIRTDSISPLYIIAGKQASKEDLDKLNPSDIERMDVIKGNAAVLTYGERGRDGVVFITLKASLKDTIPASFPGGLIEWRRYIEMNLQYPPAAQEKNKQGVVSIEMIITEQGKITEAKALNDPGDGLAEEAIRVVANGPDWIPATTAGQPVPYSFRQKITFKLGDNITGNMPVTPIINTNRFNQRMIIKTPRPYNGQPVEAIFPDYSRTSITVLMTSGRSYFLTSQDAMQVFGIALSNEGFVVPEDSKVIYYDNNAKAFDNWGGLQFVGGIPGYPLYNLFSTAKRKIDPDKQPIIVLNGKEASVEEFRKVYDNQTLRGTNLLKMQDAPALEKYGQKGKNGVLFATTRFGYPDNYLFLYNGKEIAEELIPKRSVDTKLAYQVLNGKYAEKLYGEKARFGAVIITTTPSDNSLPTMIFTKVTNPATFPGGPEALKKYLADSLRYPAAARKNKTEGTVQVEVVLDSTGAVKRVTVYNHPGDGLIEEATRIIREGPAWIPARQNGLAVAYRFVLPIVFKLDPVNYF